MRLLRCSLGLLALSGLSALAAAQPVGTEFQVNTYTTGQQATCSRNGGHISAADAIGNFVVVWHSDGPGDTYGVFARRYDSAGDPLGAEFRVNSYTPSRQWRPSVAADPSGNFVVVWSSEAPQDGSQDGIFGQRYDSGGEALGGEFQVNSYTTDRQRYPSMAADASGNFVVVWQSLGQDGSDHGIFGQRYDREGVRQGGEFQVNTATAGQQRLPSVASAPQGDFFVAWVDGDTTELTIRGQRYDSAGERQGGEFGINQTVTYALDPSVAIDAAGNSVVVWRGTSRVFARRYDSAGGELGGEFLVDHAGFAPRPDVAFDADGNFLVVWTISSDFFDAELAGQLYDSRGEAQGDKFQVNSYTGGRQQCGSVVATGPGQFVVAWESANDQDGDSIGIFGKRFHFGQATGERWMKEGVDRGN